MLNVEFLMLNARGRVLPFLFVAVFFWGCTHKTNDYYLPSNHTLDTPKKEVIIDKMTMHRATARAYSVAGIKYYPKHAFVGEVFRGMGSWYGKDFHGKLTSNGETYDMYSMTAAHKELPMNTMLEVTNLLNGKKIIVRINDRGPFVKSRILDLSYAAATKIGYAKRGTAPVRIKVIGHHGKIGYAQNDYFVKKFAIKKQKNTQAQNNIVYENVGVQIGSFKNYDGARIFLERFTKKYPYVTKPKIYFYEDTGLYKVKIKGFASEEQARDLINQEGLNGYIVKG